MRRRQDHEGGAASDSVLSGRYHHGTGDEFWGSVQTTHLGVTHSRAQSWGRYTLLTRRCFRPRGGGGRHVHSQRSSPQGRAGQARADPPKPLGHSWQTTATRALEPREHGQKIRVFHPSLKLLFLLHAFSARTSKYLYWAPSGPRHTAPSSPFSHALPAFARCLCVRLS